MKDKVEAYLKLRRKDRKRHQAMLVVLLCLSMIVTGTTAWSLHIIGESRTAQNYSDENQQDATNEIKELFCGYGEEVSEEDGHQHTLSCYSNPNADLENEQDWDKITANTKLTGNFGEDLLAIAKTQLGYQESNKNYQVVLDEEGNETEETKGYTRYGAWCGEPYGDWGTMFVSFCLNFAGISSDMLPYDVASQNWVNELEQKGFFNPAVVFGTNEEGEKTVVSAYTPEKGDLVFFDTNGDGNEDRIGIVEKLEIKEKKNSDGTLTHLYVVHTIEGDSSNQVARKEYNLNDETILGYGSLYSTYLNALDNGLVEESDVTHLSAETSEGICFSVVGKLPEGAQLVVNALTDEQNAYIEDNFGLVGYFYDIKIMVDGEKYQPEEALSVSVSGLGIDASYDLSGYHFTDVNAEDLLDMDLSDVDVESVELDNTGNRVVFDASGFSVYGISTTALEDDDDVATIADDDYTYSVLGGQLTDIDVTALDGKTFAITSYSGRYALTDSPASGGGLYGGSANSLSISDVIWTFEAVNASAGQYRIKTTSGQYLNATTSTLSLTTTLANATTFTITNPSGDADHILIRGGGTYVNAFGGEGNFSKFSVYNGTDQGSQMRLYYATEDEYHVLTDTISPSSTIINLFDYWLVDRDTSDYQDGNVNINSGIDANHALKFCLGNIGGINSWTRSAAPYQGLVKDMLVDGYPVLNAGLPYNKNGDLSTEESLAYLFDPSIAHEGKASYTDVQNLLVRDSEGYYYYNARENYAYYNQSTNSFTVYSSPAVAGNSGFGQFFPFNTLQEAASKRSTAEGINHYFGVNVTARFIQKHDGYTDSTKQRATTFEFSGDDDVWIFIDDVLVVDLGGIHDAASISINFATGEVSINGGTPTTLKALYQAAGATWTNGSSNTFANESTHTLKFFYLERGNVDSNMVLKYNLTEIPATSIFKVDQYGDTVSGATFAFYPAYVDGNPDEGTWYYANSANATSGIVSADDLNTDDITYDSQWNMTYNGTQIPAMYYGVTDSNGSMMFVDPDGMPLSLEEIQALLGETFIMREVVVPQGYRSVSDEAFLYIANNTTIICSDPYGTGVWASPDVEIVATNTLYVADTSNDLAGSLNSPYLSGNATDGYSINYYTPDTGAHGTLFAVVLKRNGVATSASDWDELNIPAWYPLYGSDEAGYVVSTQNDLAASINAAKQQALISTNVFTEQASGMQLTYTNLPGDPTRYYSYMLENNLPITATNPQYLVAYYWSTADSLDDVTVDNTLRIASHDLTTPDESSGFDNLWGATIEVPNLINALYFQKADSDGDLLDDATFALYDAATNSAGKGFYVGESQSGNTVYIRLDEINGTKVNGAATVYDSLDATNGTVGTYAIQNGTTQNGGYITDSGAGTITVIAGSDTYTITPAVNAPAGGSTSLVGYTHDTCSFVTNETGTGHFHYLKTGTYFLKEIASPNGYSLNFANIPVEVTDEGVYANAGTTDDNVRVGNGVGYVVKTMDVFASLSNIDETLSWIYTHLKVENGTTSDFLANLDGVFNKHVISGGTGFDGYGISSGASTSYIPTGSLTNGTSEYLTSGTDETGAMTQYLRYEGDLSASIDENKIFDYALYSRGAGFETGVQAYRLWTESGWSDLAIFQDTDFGQSQITTGSTTNYTVLDDEISQIFSSSTFVQITDKLDVDLTITKVTNDFETEVSPGNTTAATVYLDGAEFYLKNSSNLYYSYDEELDKTSWVASIDNATKLVSETYFKANGASEFSKIDSTSIMVENGVYTKIFTINGTDYTLTSYNNGAAVFTPVSGSGNLTGTLRRSYFKVYNLTEGTYTLTEVTSPTYELTLGGLTTTESFNEISPITIKIKSGSYYYYVSSVTNNQIIVPSSDITLQSQADGSQIPVSFTYTDVDGNTYENIALTAAASGSGYTYDFNTSDDGTGTQITGTLYSTTGNGFAIDVTSNATTRVFHVDATGSTAPYYEDTDAYQAGFRVMNTTETNDKSVTLVKVDKNSVAGTTISEVGYNDVNSMFTVSQEEDVYLPHRILTGAKFYLYYTTVEGGEETRYYYSLADDGSTVQWSTELTNASMFSVDQIGSLKFESLNGGNTYHIVECQAPDGYNPLTNEIIVSWDENTGEIIISGEENAVIQVVTETNAQGDDESVSYIVVYNSSDYALPHTGGSGTRMITLSGSLMIIASLAYLYLNKRKQERRGAR